MEDLDRMRAGLDEWLGLCRGLSADELRRQPEPGVWSIQQNTFHLGDAVEATLIRLAAMLAEDEPVLLRFDADEWAAERRYQDREWSEAVERLTGGLATLRERALALRPDELARTGIQPNLARNYLGLDTDVITVAQLLRFEAGHVEEHLASVRAIVGAPVVSRP